MGDFGPVIAAVLATLMAIIGGRYTAKRLDKLGFGQAQMRINTTLRELAEVEQAKGKLIAEENVALRKQLEDTQHDLDTCARQLFKANTALSRRRRPVAPE